MLIFELTKIGNKLYTVRKRMGLTQAEVAEAAELSTRTYADIERGSVNMRIESVPYKVPVRVPPQFFVIASSRKNIFQFGEYFFYNALQKYEKHIIIYNSILWT